VSRNKITIGLVVLLLACAIGTLIFFGPVRQDETYHSFADRRTIAGIPNFWNVISNLPFALIGAMGWLRVRSSAARILFAGVFLTAFGSAYYHWAPDNARLLWDRLPMTIVFMTVFTMVLGERFPRGMRLLLPLVAMGIASVLFWQWSGDLRPYVLVQFAPMVIIPMLMLLLPKTTELWWVILFYALAKVAEAQDARIYSVFFLSGHTLKHLLSATAIYYLLRWPRATI
jgi:ceramidase